MGSDRKKASRIGMFGCLALACLCFLLVQSRYAFGQVDEGSISGTVQDQSGAVVAGAQVTLVNTDQGITLQTRTNGTGAYTFSPVKAGHYQVRVTANGFDPYSFQVVVSQTGQKCKRRLRVTLSVAGNECLSGVVLVDP